MQFIIRNQTLLTVVIAWAMAQVIKTILYRVVYGEIRMERLVGSGGMPSSHSSTVCALAMSALLDYGVHSFQFTVSFVLAAIVMYDAMNVRLETGKQAIVLNKILEENPFEWQGEVLEKKLKELVGHTPLQVLCGGILGVAVAVVIEWAVYRA